MNSFNTQLQIEDMYDQDDYAALLQYCEERSADDDAQELHWENVWMDINNEFQSNQLKTLVLKSVYIKNQPSPF